MTAVVLVNGSRETHVDSADRAFTLGDGLFETIAVRAGEPARWPLHYARLAAGCRQLRLPCPAQDLLGDEIQRAIDKASDGVLRITVSRGPGPPGYAPPQPAHPTRVVRFVPRQPDSPTAPIAVRRCDFRLAVQPALAGIKHLNRLEQILARAEWDDPAIAEGLMFDTDGWLVEATASNVFLVHAGHLYTPALDRCGVAGVLRSCVLAVAERCGIAYSVTRLGAADLATAEEVFVTNSVTGLRAVSSVDASPYAAPGPVTRTLAGGLDDMTACAYREV